MRYLAFPGWMMTLSNRQDGYLNQRVILFRLQYETHSLQMHPKSLCRSVVAPTSKLPEQRYALRLVVVPCWYFPSPLQFFQPISPSPSSHISSVSVPHLLHRRIHPCCPVSPPLCLSAAVFTADLVCHTYLPRLCCVPYHIIFHLYVYFAAIVCLPSPVGSSHRSDLFYTTLLALLYSKLLFSLSFLIFSLNVFSLFWNGSSISPWFSFSASICNIFHHFPSLRSAPIWSFPSALYDLVCFLHLWSAQIWLFRSCSDLLSPICLDHLSQICSVFSSSGPSNWS